MAYQLTRHQQSKNKENKIIPRLKLLAELRRPESGLIDPCSSFFMVKMASGMARRRVRPTEDIRHTIYSVGRTMSLMAAMLKIRVILAWHLHL